MKRKEPILFDPDSPLAHYERARKLKTKTDSTLGRCRFISVAAFIVGAACVLYNPEMMAMNAFFGLLFCLFSSIGCWLKRPLMCLVSIPFGIIAAIAAGLSGSVMAPIGAAAFFLASGLEIFAVNAAYDHHMLKELPGFPFFDASMDDISFAAKDRFGSDQFIDSSSMHEEKERIKLLPSGEPSDDMGELTVPEQDIPEDDDTGSVQKEPKALVWDNDSKREDRTISDVELFG